MKMRRALVWLACGFLSASGAGREALVPGVAGVSGGSLSSGVTWIENEGQFPGELLFAARLGGSIVGAEPWGLLIVRREEGSDRGVVVRLAFEGARPGIVPVGRGREPGRHSFFLGSDPEQWRADLSSFAEVIYEELYPGIDLVLREGPQGLEYDLHLEPGADLSQVVLRCDGVDSAHRQDDGAIVLETAVGPLVQPVGRSFELLPDGTEKTIDVGHRMLGALRFGFEAVARDPERPLVVDPELVWSTYLGGSGSQSDNAWAVTVGANGDVTVTGETDWASFPTTPGAFQSTLGARAIFVTRLDAEHGQLVYSSVIGTGADRPLAIAVDSAGRAAVVGWTISPNFPVTPGAFDTAKSTNPVGRSSAFVFRLGAEGTTLEYSTYLDCVLGSEAFGVALLDTGQVIVGGEAYSDDFPVTPGAFQTVLNGPLGNREGFVTRLDPTGSSLEWSTFLGGTQDDRIFALGVDDAGMVTVAGQTGSLDFPLSPGAFDTHLTFVDVDAFVTRLSSDGSSLVWSTYLGGEEDETGYTLALEPSGAVAVGGWTYSPDFPITPGAFAAFTPPLVTPWEDGFATRVAPDGTALLASTCIGSDRHEHVTGISVDPSGIVSVVVWATDTGLFPTTPGAFSTVPTNNDDFAVCRFDPDMTRLLYSTLLGGLLPETPSGLAMSPSRRVTVVGNSWGGYPTTPGAVSPNNNGGTIDAVVTTFDLVLEGIELVGRSRPACLGPIGMNATEMPLAGSGTFAFYASGAPPSAKGWLVIARKEQHVPVPFGHLTAPHVIPVQADGQGYVETPYPLASAAAGQSFRAWYLFRNPSACTGQGPWSWSNSLHVTVQ